MKIKIVLTAIAIVLSMTQTFAEDNKEPEKKRHIYKQGELRKLISVVKTKNSPIIDGIMEKGEWGNATVITGLTKVGNIGQAGVHGNPWAKSEKNKIANIAANQSKFWITYDDNNLYVAYFSRPPERIRNNPAMIQVMLRKNQTLHDSNLDRDDSINLEIMSPKYPGGDNYVIMINSIGTTFECIWSGTVKRDITLDWDPAIVTRSTLTLDGWFIETTIPWNELGPDIKKPKPGDVLYMNFGRLIRGTGNESHAWKAYDGYRPKGEVIFEGNEGVVVQLKDTGNLPKGNAVFSAEIKNFSSTNKKIIVEVSTNSGELKDKKEMILKARQSIPYNFTGKIVDFATKKIAFTVKDAATGKIIHVTTLPVIRKTKPDIFIRRYRTKEIMKFEIDMTFIGVADPKTTKVELTLTNKRTGSKIFAKTFENFTCFKPVFELSTKGWAPADYDAKFVFSAPGVKTYTKVVLYKHPNLPVWWNNKYGLEDIKNDRVPYPWIDMKLVKDSIYVWGRIYTFGKGFFPKQITTLGHSIFRSPMRIILKTSNGKIIDTAIAKVNAKWTKINKTRIEGERIIEAKKFSLKNNLWVEYDGLVWNTLTINPKEKIKIVSLELEIALNNKFTDIINTMDYSLRTTGLLKPEGYVGPPTRPLWLGNGDGGIQFVNSEENRFFVKDFKKVLRVERSKNGATLRVVLIDTPTELNKTYKIQFGIIATPVRPKMIRIPSFRKESLGTGGPWYPKGMEFVAAADPGHSHYGNKAGRVYVHTEPLNVSPESMKLDAVGKDDYLFADEIRADYTSRNLDRMKIDFKSKVSRDYFVWRHWRFQQKYGFKGLYYDGTCGVSLGLRDVMRRLYNITLSNQHYGAREVNIGIHSSAMINMAAYGFGSYNWDAENYNSIINDKQQTYLGVLDPALFRAQHMGHNFGWPVTFLGLDRMTHKRVEANGGAEVVYDQITGLVLLHDGERPICIMERGLRGVSKRMDDAIKKYHLKHWVYQFIPYWKQDFVKLPNKNMHASFYIARPSKLTATNSKEYRSRLKVFEKYFDKHLPKYIKRRNALEIEEARKELSHMKDRVVMIIYNNTDWEGVIHLKPDWKKLGLGAPEYLKAENAVHSTGFRVEKVKDKNGKVIEKPVFFERPEEYAKIENSELVFPMTKYNYRMIVLEKK